MLIDTLTSSQVYFTNKSDKKKLLLHLLETQAKAPTIVFLQSRYAAERLAKVLHQKGYSCTTLHQRQGKAMRQKSIERFQQQEAQILIATDAILRNLSDVSATFLIQYHIPEAAAPFQTRIEAVNTEESPTNILLCAAEENTLVEQLKTQFSLTTIDAHPFPQTEATEEVVEQTKAPTPTIKKVAAKTAIKKVQESKAPKASNNKEKAGAKPKAKSNKRRSSAMPSSLKAKCKWPLLE